ncbi:MAG: radical SAM protein [Nanoarchaeota archaeon]|nr:radical SAM protein [Nanoarchaeota archaeon]
MKILLINPPRTYFRGSKGPRVGLPLGLLYLAGVLEKNGYSPKIFDCLVVPTSKIFKKDDKIIHGIPDNDILEFIKKEKPNVVGITNPFTAQLDNAIHIADLTKSIDKEIITVIGGPYASVRGRELLENEKNIDIVVKMEGEYTFLDLIKKIDKKLPIDDIGNILYRDKKNNIIENKCGEFIKNLDELPLPAYHLIDMDRYFSFFKRGIGARTSIYNRSISMITSRGCPYNCIFCSIHLHMGNFFRAHSSDYVIRYIKYVVEKYRIKHISFEDDNFTLDTERCKKIILGIIENQIKITWDTPNGIRADRIDEELVELMKRSGCVELIFGIESGSQRVLDEIIDKKLKLENVINAIKLCQKYRIKTKAFFVIGFPGETKEDILKTKNFSLELYKKYKIESGLLIATPLFGTRLYRVCKSKGYLIKEPDPRMLSIATQADGHGLIKTEEFDPAYLKKVAMDAVRIRARIRFKEKLLNPRNYLSGFKFVVFHPLKTFKHLKEKIF